MNKKIIIIGATSGIGREVALVYIAQGWTVGVAGRREAELESLRAMAPKQVFTQVLDVTKEDAADIEFELEVKSVTANAAEITISHNGHEDDTWYAFATTSSNVSLSIDKAVEELTAGGGKVSGLSSGTKQTVTVDGLEHSTDYTYIVFAMTAEGDVYGSHQDVSFTTPMGFAPNAEWSVEYTGRQFIGENEYEHTVTVESSDKNPYFITVVTKDRYDNTAIGDLIGEEMASLEQFISEYNRYYGEHTTIKDWSHIGDGIDAFGIELGRKYVAMAIGVTHNSELTGHYSVSEEFLPY